jgi:hypothetical protein
MELSMGLKKYAGSDEDTENDKFFVFK